MTIISSLKNFLKRLRPKSEYERMNDYLSQAVDNVHLEYLQRQWDIQSRRPFL